MAESKPELKHEFIAMMFAVTVGEVGLQVATFIHQKHYLHYLPAYSHLLLATVVIAASFVGWAKSISPGAQRDVQKVLEWEFVILLVDMLLVVIYFILVRAIDFQKSPGGSELVYKPNAQPEAFWIGIIFTIYLVWDVVSKFFIKKRPSWKLPKYLWTRIVVTAICCALGWVTCFVVGELDETNVVIADVSLIALVLLFRALKDVASAKWPDLSDAQGDTTKEGVIKQKARESLPGAFIWTIVLGIILVLGDCCCGFGWHPLPHALSTEISAKYTFEP